MAEIKIDGKLFQERIAHFVSAWKADKRAGDAVFAGASSIVIMMGKVEETPEFHKNNAVHVRPDLMGCLRSPPFASVLALLPPSSADILLVLAARLRISYHPHALHNRYPLHPHYSEER